MSPLRKQFSASSHRFLSLAEVSARMYNGVVGFLPTRAINRISSFAHLPSAAQVWAFLRHGGHRQ